MSWEMKEVSALNSAATNESLPSPVAKVGALEF